MLVGLALRPPEEMNIRRNRSPGPRPLGTRLQSEETVKGVTGRVASLVSLSGKPPPSVKVTRTLMVLSRSALPSLWVAFVAPEMSLSVAPSLRIHW